MLFMNGMELIVLKQNFPLAVWSHMCLMGYRKWNCDKSMVTNHSKGAL